MKKNIRLTIALILSTPLLFAQGTIDREIFISRYYLQEAIIGCIIIYRDFRTCFGPLFGAKEIYCKYRKKYQK